MEQGFRGITLNDLLKDSSLDETGLSEPIRRYYSRLLELWREWGEDRSLVALPDFKEQTRLFAEAENEVSQSAYKDTLGRIDPASFPALSPDEIVGLVNEYIQEVRDRANDVLQERGYIAPFDTHRVLVDATTLEPQNFDVDRKDQNLQPINAFAESLYTIPAGSGLGWRDFRDFYRSKLAPEDVELTSFATDPDLVVGTSKVSGHLTAFLANSRLHNFSEVLEIRKYGRKELLEARSRVDLPPSVQRPDTTKLLTVMQTTLLKRKEESASLLKTHMYLTDRAYKTGGDNPVFMVDMDELLRLKGYTRRDSGAFHTKTYREEWGRIVALAGCWVEINRVVNATTKEVLVDETPYWEVRARRRVKEGETIGLEAILLEDPEFPIVRQAVIQPGLWWAVSDRGTMNFHLPYGVLALPTDGQGNEANRLAVQIAATLALWVRSSQQQHAGKSVFYAVGKLLEASGVKTKEEFDREGNQKAKRLRKYLAGTPDDSDGAISRLADLKAFDITINDEEVFWTSGKGWQEQFWNSKLAVKIPDLGIKKRKVKASSKTK